MKKIFWISTALLVSLTAFAGCTRRSAAENATTTENAVTETVPAKNYEALELHICNYVSDKIYQTGWFADVVKEKFNITIYQDNFADHESNDEDCFTLQGADLVIMSYSNIKDKYYEIYSDYEPLTWADACEYESGKKLLEIFEAAEGTDYYTFNMDDIFYVFTDPYSNSGTLDTEEKGFIMQKNNPHNEQVLDFLAWYFDTEGTLTVRFGPEGLCWGVDENGKYYITDAGYKLSTERVLNYEDGTTEDCSEYFYGINLLVKPWYVEEGGFPGGGDQTFKSMLEDYINK